MTLSKSDIASEHLGTVRELGIKRYGIDPQSLLKEKKITDILRQLVRIVKGTDTSSQSHMVIPMYQGYLKSLPLMYDKIRQDVTGAEREGLLYDIASWLFWSCYERCDFELKRKAG